ncbi:MAG: nucleotidyl transferase AbiEii/AbiGii toxin family protein [Planctomycetes bacterium]|nr:nucleotidyl transferase AbiEii/AbiGii toxin family protein [Planctomycetota bacterium]
MESEKLIEILRRLNEAGIRYAVIGGLAYAEYAPPRATEDMDLLVLTEDAAKVRDLFPGCYLRGTAIAGIYEFEGTRFDILPVRRRVQSEVLESAVDWTFHGVPIRLVTLRDLIFLKLWAASERSEPLNRAQDHVDASFLLRYNEEKLTQEDVAWMARQLLALAYTPEDRTKYLATLAWLNKTLEDLGMGHLKPPAP